MGNFGYIINLKKTNVYSLNGSFNKLKMYLPLIKDDVIKISDIYDRENQYIGDVISIPMDKEPKEVIILLEKYLQKNRLDFICLGDLINTEEYLDVQSNKLIYGIKGIEEVIVNYIKRHLRRDIWDTEIVIGIDKYNVFINDFIKFFSTIGNFITITGYNIGLDENLFDEVYSQYGLSLNFTSDYRKMSRNVDIFINFSKFINPEHINFRDNMGLILDPFLLINFNRDYGVKLINKFSLIGKDIVIFNKLNVINNEFPPQLIESIIRARGVNGGSNLSGLIREEIEGGEYTILKWFHNIVVF